jgi:flagellar assembly factor FliW
MSTVTVESSRFGTLEIEAGAIIEFPAGLIGLGGRRWAVVTNDPESAFQWLHSLDDASLALPVTNPWAFFSDYEVELSDADSERFPSDDVAVWVTVRAGTELADFSANLRAPIVISNGQGYQVINEAANAPVRASLFPEATADAKPAAA